ncbi:MAG: hypothetical protein SF053_10090, partial [Bacteroidia bacterium]|nr:hypothetical protein [Bacteroidia bacterium]
ENDYVDPEELAEAKIQEMRKVAAAIIEDMTRQEVEAEAAQKLAEVQAQVEQAQAEAEHAQAQVEQAQTEAEQAKAQLALTLKNALKRGKLTVEEIAEDFNVPVSYVQQLRDELQDM